MLIVVSGACPRLSRATAIDPGRDAPPERDASKQARGARGGTSVPSGTAEVAADGGATVDARGHPKVKLHVQAGVDCIRHETGDCGERIAGKQALNAAWTPAHGQSREFT